MFFADQWTKVRGPEIEEFPEVPQIVDLTPEIVDVEQMLPLPDYQDFSEEFPDVPDAPIEMESQKPEASMLADQAKKLKKTQVEKKHIPRDQMLNNIRTGVSLKKVVVEAKKKPDVPTILLRRAAIEMSDTSDSEWE